MSHGIIARNVDGKVWRTSIRAWDDPEGIPDARFDEKVIIERRSEYADNIVRIECGDTAVFVELDNLKVAVDAF